MQFQIDQIESDVAVACVIEAISKRRETLEWKASTEASRRNEAICPVVVIASGAFKEVWKL